jgi:hypothetical protein
MPFHVLRRIIPLTVALALTACADLTGLDFVGGNLTSISVEHGAIVEVGDTVRLSATGSVDGIIGLLSYDRLLDASWAISDQTIAQLQLLPPPPPPPQDSSTPTRTLVRGRRPGTVTVTATARGLSGEAPVRVIHVVATIQVRAARDTLAVGDTIVVTTAVLDAGGAPILGVPLTFDVGGAAQLDGHDDTSARVVAIAAGPATVSVRFRRATGVATLVVLSPLP